VKNNFALAATVSMLALGMIAYPGGYASAGQTKHGLDNLRWGTDYLLISYLGTTGNNSVYAAQVLLHPSHNSVGALLLVVWE